ncbi:glycoside hydrolase family 16 protein [Bradyrhizobium niftali]|uniref:Glycoside hydrolase family 16 protein n=1 Tax=Bradyrhizobium niftali TaxID=2560055 RepID=A0A4Y9LIG2_9BRAD|nr:glycoside hydrolase family 16 protein [Bradyrhizobium niftali]TFV43135.1 glycoside hydrolase family 16 protein [Bradyrhizobium niftali]
MSATRRQVLAGAASVVCLTGDLYATRSRADTPANVVQSTESEIAVSIDNATLGSEDRVARVPVALSVPTNRTIALEYFARERANESNRPGPQANTSQTIARGYLIFQPGEQQKTIEVPLPRPLQPGRSLEVELADYFIYPQHVYASRVGRVTTDDGTPTHPTPRDDLFELPPLPARGTVVFSDDLRDTDFASDSGFRLDGRPCWQSRYSHGRRHDSNQELAYYADPTLNPEAKVWGSDPSTGHRFIQAEYVENGLSDGKGGKLLLGWQKNVPFRYTAAIVTSRTLFNRITTGSYVEFDVKLSKIAGSWPALWLKRVGDGWPPEIDILEAFIKSSAYPADAVTSSIHWLGDKGHRTYGASVPLTHVEPGADIFARFNRFGCFLSERQITYYFNGKPFCAMPNLVGVGPWYMLIDVTVGGVVGQPPDASIFPARMYIASVKVIQFG